MRFETKLAYRHLVSGGGQTLLTVAAVAIAVTVIIFINTLITGVQTRILKDLLGQLAHINIKAPRPRAEDLIGSGWRARSARQLLPPFRF